MNHLRHFRHNRHTQTTVEHLTIQPGQYVARKTPRTAAWVMCVVAILIEVWLIIKATLQFLNFLPVPAALSFDCLGILCVIMITRRHTLESKGH